MENERFENENEIKKENLAPAFEEFKAADKPACEQDSPAKEVSEQSYDNSDKLAFQPIKKVENPIMNEAENGADEVDESEGFAFRKVEAKPVYEYQHDDVQAAPVQNNNDSVVSENELVVAPEQSVDVEEDVSLTVDTSTEEYTDVALKQSGTVGKKRGFFNTEKGKNLWNKISFWLLLLLFLIPVSLLVYIILSFFL